MERLAPVHRTDETPLLVHADNRHEGIEFIPEGDFDLLPVAQFQHITDDRTAGIRLLPEIRDQNRLVEQRRNRKHIAVDLLDQVFQSGEPLVLPVDPVSDVVRLRAGRQQAERHNPYSYLLKHNTLFYDYLSFCFHT